MRRVGKRSGGSFFPDDRKSSGGRVGDGADPVGRDVDAVELLDVAGDSAATSGAWTGDRNRLSGSQALRRKKNLLPGLLECGICGAKLTFAGDEGRRRHSCANHKKKGKAVCAGMPDLRQADAERLAFHALRARSSSAPLRSCGG